MVSESTVEPHQGEYGPAVLVALKAVLAADHVLTPPVISGSMRPWIKAGDKVTVRAVGPQDLSPGDIVVLSSSAAQLVTHRYISGGQAEGGPCLMTKGDRSHLLDPPWLPDALVGRVGAIIRDGRHLALDRGQGRVLHRLVSTLVLWEWACVDHLPFSCVRRLLGKSVHAVAWVVSSLGWRLVATDRPAEDV